jgi:hypothetical protein
MLQDCTSPVAQGKAVLASSSCDELIYFLPFKLSLLQHNSTGVITNGDTSTDMTSYQLLIHSSSSFPPCSPLSYIPLYPHLPSVLSFPQRRLGNGLVVIVATPGQENHITKITN